MSKRTRLIFGTLVAMAMIVVSSVAPALAEVERAAG